MKSPGSTGLLLLVGVSMVGLLIGLFVAGANVSAPPEDVTTPDAAAPAEERAAAERRGGSRPSPAAGEAAQRLREAADCLDATRRNLLAVLSSPGREQLVVNGFAQACGLLHTAYSGLSREAGALLGQVASRIDMSALAHADNEEELDSVLDDIIAAYDREADRLTGGQESAP